MHKDAQAHKIPTKKNGAKSQFLPFICVI